MKVVVNSYDLANAVNKVIKAVDTKGIVKILEGIKIKTKNDTLTLTAYDGEIGIETKIKCETFEEGAIVVAGKLFAEYINKVGSQLNDIEISTKDNGQAKFVCGKVKFMLSTMNALEFPVIAQDIKENSFEISVANLKKIVSQTVFCAATDEARPILKGCFLTTTDNNELLVSAVDGFRLGVAKQKINEVKGVNRVLYDLTPKPTGTIEWE